MRVSVAGEGRAGAGREATPETYPRACGTSNFCFTDYGTARAGAMPAKVSENIRATLIAGLAELVELVKK
jgi:hypothetical protein